MVIVNITILSKFTKFEHMVENVSMFESHTYLIFSAILVIYHDINILVFNFFRFWYLISIV